MFEIVDDIVAFGHPVDIVGFVDNDRHARLAADLFDLGSLAVRAGNCSGVVLNAEFFEFGGDFRSVRTAGQFV